VVSVTPLTFSNPHVQRLRRLLGRRSARHDEGVFVVEGPTLIGEAVAAGWRVTEQFVAPGAEPLVADGTVHQLGPGVLERAASTETPQPVLAVVEMQRPEQAALDAATFLVVADALSDPGNAGTILRSAEASGADAVVLTRGSVDVYNPKVVRASAGALFHVPVFTDLLLAEVRRPGRRLLGTSSHQGQTHTATDLVAPVALVVGNEAHGLADDAAVDGWITIAQRGRSESLNVAMAATVLCFEVARQRSA
jgi:TrmH family RNA methyltransferase